MLNSGCWYIEKEPTFTSSTFSACPLYNWQARLTLRQLPAKFPNSRSCQLPRVRNLNEARGCRKFCAQFSLFKSVLFVSCSLRDLVIFSVLRLFLCLRGVESLPQDEILSTEDSINRKTEMLCYCCLLLQITCFLREELWTLLINRRAVHTNIMTFRIYRWRSIHLFSWTVCFIKKWCRKGELLYDSWGPARTFIAKLLRKFPCEGCTHWRKQRWKKPYDLATNSYGSAQWDLNNFVTRN